MTTNRMLVRARRGLAVAAALAVLSPLASTQAGVAKTTKKAAAKKKATATTVKKKATAKTAVTTKKAVTTAAPAADQGSGKNITGVEIAPGAPIKIGATWGKDNEQFTGDVGQAYEIAFDVLRKKGMLPVHGRDVVVVTRPYSSFAPDVQAAIRGACTSLVQDDKVFAALTWAGPADCLAENKIPAVGGALTDETMKRVWPYGFSFSWNANTDLENIPPWADSLNLLKGKKLGLYHGSQSGRQKQLNDYFKPALKKLGYTIAEDLSTGATSVTSDAAADRIAVQRFKAAGVDTIFLMNFQPGDFMKAARAQGYKPKYILAGPEAPLISDGSPARLGIPGELADGSYALSWRRTGENGLPGNPPASAAGTECATNYEKFSGERVRITGTPQEQNRWQSIQWACDGALAVVRALKAAGPKLTHGTFINGLESSIKDQQSGLFTDISFSPTSHFGASAIKTVQLEGDCLCWRTKGSFRKPFVA